MFTYANIGYSELELTSISHNKKEEEMKKERPRQPKDSQDQLKN